MATGCPVAGSDWLLTLSHKTARGLLADDRVWFLPVKTVSHSAGCTFQTT